VLVPDAERTLSAMGVDSPPDGTEPVAPGATVRAANTAVATPLSERDADVQVPRSVFDTGAAAPLAGATFGLGVLSTPDASIAGQSANPLVGIDTPSLLQRDEARRMLRQAGVTDAASVEWLAGPQAVSADGDGEDGGASMLGTTTEIEQFVGVVNGETGPWGVRVHVARITEGDHVIAAGVDRRPLASTESGFMDADHGTRLQRARELMVETVGRLQSR
jgi:hypothetical protein